MPELVPAPPPQTASTCRPDPRQGVFETMLALDGRPIELDAHLARLRTSLGALFPRCAIPDLSDVPPGRGHHGYTSDGTSASALRITVAPNGSGALEATIARRPAPSGGVVSLRSLQVPGGLGPHKWADRSLLDSAQADLPEGALPLIVDSDSAVLEASRANVFVVRDGALFTPPLDGRILPGVTRMRVLEIAAPAGLKAHEVELSREDLLAADEIFLTGSVRGVEPVASLDGAPLPRSAPLATQLAAELRRTWFGTPVA